MATTTDPQSEFATKAKRAEIVQLKLAGHPNQRIAERVGITEGGVRWHTREWLAELRPSTERTEELREVQGAAVDDLTARLSEHVMKPLRSFEGSIIYGDDDKAVMTPDVQVIDRLVKLMERKARLFGLDLTQQISIGINVSAEAIASLFAADEGEGQRVIEGTATEVTADA